MATDPDPQALAAELRLALGQLVRRVRADSGVPIGRLAVLGLLDREGPRTTSELATAQAVRHQSMTRTVALLEADDMVRRTPHPSDGRKTVVEIAPAGHDALRAERERRVDWLADEIAAALSPAERRRLAEGVELLGRLAR